MHYGQVPAGRGDSPRHSGLDDPLAAPTQRIAEMSRDERPRMAGMSRGAVPSFDLRKNLAKVDTPTRTNSNQNFRTGGGANGDYVQGSI